MAVSTVVFAGPSISHEEARAVLPGAGYLPPIARGDLPAAVAAGARTVVIIDGVFHQRLPVSPLEIKEALGRGVRVYGAASMGALRAAEMYRHGMVGVGLIYQWYRTGVVVADHEVGLLFDPASYRALTVPLVNVRYSLLRATEDGLLTDVTAGVLLSRAKAIHYTELNYPSLLRSSSDVLPLGLTARSFTTYLESFDLKQQDALACLGEVRRAGEAASTEPTE
jgi:hypothetical protein